MKKIKMGFSLIEMLVVVTLFALIGALVSQSTVVSLVSSRKSDASAKVRENLNYAYGVLERKLRGAQSVPTCNGTTQSSINFLDEDGVQSSLSCGLGNSITLTTPSGSMNLTSQDVNIPVCEFTCSQPNTNLPPQIRVRISGRSAQITGVEDTTVTLDTSINLRVY